MASFDVESFFTNIPLQETIDLCVQKLFEDKNFIDGLSNDSFREMLTVTMTEFFILFGNEYGQLISISPHSLVFLKTMNTDFSEIEIWFTDQNNNALEIEDNVNISLIINTS